MGARNALASALASALGDAVLLPGSARYDEAVASVLFADAALKRPSCIVQPRGAADVVMAMRTVSSEPGGSLTVRGGSHSALCAADGAALFDLSANMNRGWLDGDDVIISGGATMGTLLETLAPRSRVVPVGVLASPGLGLALHGGVGHLSRALGLSVDHLREVEIVVPSGELLRVSDASSGEEAELWWAIRGAGPSFGVVTSARFSAKHLPRLYFSRLVVDLDALPAYFEFARALPRDTSASAAIGPPAAGAAPAALLIYVVFAGDDADGRARTDKRVREFLGEAMTRPQFEVSEALPYVQMPPFDVPSSDGEIAPAARPSDPLAQRTFVFIKVYFLGRSLDAAAAASLASSIEAAPTPLCRIDLQHAGGAVQDAAPDSSAFWNRDWEWSCVVTGAWVGPDGEREACVAWVDETIELLRRHVVGTYASQIRPGLPGTEADVRLAYGQNLPKLRTLKHRWDPDNALKHYYPL